MIKSIIFLFSLLLTSNSWAKIFSNQYIQFDLPPGWECALEGSEWVCQSENDDRKREAIIIMAAKIRGEQDSLEKYQAYLNQTKTYSLPGGSSQVSEPRYVKMTQITDHPWIDALHLASEVPGFYTRYLATVKSDLGVAVTFSVVKDLYAKYQPIFDKIISSMRVFRQDKMQMADLSRKTGNEQFGKDIFENADPNIRLGGRGKTQARKEEEGGGNNLLLIIGGLAIAGFIFLKKKRG